MTVVVPNDFPQFYKWMPGHKEIVIHEKYPDFAEQLIRDADVLFCLDFNEPKRIEKLAPAVVAAEGRRVMIDHHLNPADFCRVTMSYPEMSSTSEMVFRFICRMVWNGYPFDLTAFTSAFVTVRSGTAGNSIGAYSLLVPSILIAPVDTTISPLFTSVCIPPQVPILINVSAPHLQSSSIAIAADGPPIPVDVTLTFT